MGTLDLFGVIVGAIIFLFGIGFAIWFFAIRNPSGAVSQRSCSNDTDCINTGSPPSDAFGNLQYKYPGEICVQGTCRPSTGSTNQACANQFPGSTAFTPSTSGSNVLGCVPLVCETTDDCLIPGVNLDSSKVACIQAAGSGPGICIPTEVKNSERKVVNGTCFPDLKLDDGKCVIDQETNPCQPGSVYDQDKGSCFRCGDTTSNLCPTGTNAGPFDFCDTNDNNSCSSGNTCSKTFSNGELATLPNGNSLPNGVGFCLPETGQGNQNECIYNWFNINAGPTGPGSSDLGPGYCPSNKPYCVQSGPGERLVCNAIPNGALCNGIAGLPNKSNGSFDRGGGGNEYNMTGICDGILVPENSFAAPAGFGVDGKPLPDPGTNAGNNISCTAGTENPSGSGCQCKPSKNKSDQSNEDCPLGTYCQKIGAVSKNGNNGDSGICMIAHGTQAPTGATGPAGTFANAPRNGQLGHLYQNYFCAPPDNNAPGAYRCQPYPSQTNFQSSLSTFTSIGAPGSRCYVDTDCALNFGSETSGFGKLTCQNGRCYGKT